MVIQIDTTQVTAALAFVAGVGSAAVVLWVRVVKPIRKGLTWFEQFRDDWTGIEDRPGVPGRPGVMLRLAGMEARQGGIEVELRTNGGASLKDAVRRTEAAVAVVQAQLEAAHVIALPAPLAQPQRPDGASSMKGETT